MSNQIKDLVRDLHLIIHELTEENKQLKDKIMDKLKIKEIRKQVRSAEIRNDLEYANSQPNENELMEKKIDNYIEWYRTDNSDPYGELKWLIDLLLNSKHKEDIEQVLDDTYEQ